MILPFKLKFENGDPTNFPDKIIAGEKIHTIRNAGRFKVGHELHMATGVRTKNYVQFNKNYSNLKYVRGIQKLSIKWNTCVGDQCLHILPEILIDGKMLNETEAEILAKNDGFKTLDSFLEWFFEDNDNLEIIHWTDFKYGKN